MTCFRLSPLMIAAAVVSSMVPAAYGQNWEVGAGGGASFYNTNTVTGGSSDVTAKFQPGGGFNAYLGQIGNRLGGEVDYTWLSNSMELSGNGHSYTMGGHTQAIHYDVLVYFKDKESKVRPYILGGGGMKQYTGTGEAVAVQPLGNLVVLTNTSQWKPLIAAGGGVRVVVSPHMQVRADVRVMMTQAPTDVITPVVGNLGGWYFDIVPTVGLSYVW